MKAVLLDQHGPSDVLRLGDNLPVPEPGPGEVRVRMRAVALNYLDIWVRNGWPGLKLDYPHVPGADGAGVIDALGDGVTEFSVGDRVAIDPTVSCGVCSFCCAGWQNRCVKFGILGEHRRGTFAELIVVPARNLLTIPEQVTFGEAAAASLVFVTAWHSLITRGNLRPGETVLIVGAGGGVNTACLQIAKLIGCTVYVIGSSENKLAQARALGADMGILRGIEGGWSRAVYQLTAKRGVDVVVDNVGAATLNDSLRSAARGGRILTVGNTSGPKAEIDNRLIFGKHLSLIGSTMGPHQDYVTAMSLIFQGKLKAVIGATYPIEQVAEAERALEEGKVFGKVVLEF